MLHQLKNGNWINLMEVKEICFHEPLSSHPDNPPYVQIRIGERRIHLIYFDKGKNFLEAIEYRDELAELANMAQGKGRQSHLLKPLKELLRLCREQWAENKFLRHAIDIEGVPTIRHAKEAIEHEEATTGD